ncbi:hypothetical protein [Yoonia sp. R2-816]|uniref:hypothetical protein n=1 Tax=Yoonia sp. R2-816 TaxID=3342638 RepID=UPI00372CB48E
MPHKTPKPRKTGAKPLSVTNRRVIRPDPVGGRPGNVPQSPNRQRRDSKRPPRFPGRLGGR